MSGTDGDLDAVYEVLYEDDEVYIVDHLVQDYRSGSVDFYYAQIFVSLYKGTLSGILFTFIFL